MSAIARILRLFAASVVPGGGFLFAGWSPSTALALYWVDNLVGALVMSARIALHRQWTGVAGHARPHLNATVTYSTGDNPAEQVQFKSFLAEFLLTSVGFNVAQGIFLAVVLGFFTERPDMDQVRQGAISILVLHVLALAIDTMRLRDWPFARLKYQAQNVMNRVILVHMAILGGMMFFALRGTPGAFFSVFVWLKFFADIGSMLPQWNPTDPPRWLVSFVNLFPKQKGGTFEEHWRRERAKEEALAREDETVGPPQRPPQQPPERPPEEARPRVPARARPSKRKRR